MSNIEIRKPGAFTMDGGFNIKNIDPIDSRTYVNDINHIYLSENWEGLKPYPGLIVSDPTGEIRVCVNSAYTATTSWLVVRTNNEIDDGGNGGVGTVTASTIDEANTLAADESNIGLLIYVTSGDGIGLYVVGGKNNLIKINTSDVTEITNKITTLETSATTLNNEITTLKGNVITGVTYNGENINKTNNVIEVSGITNNYYTKSEINEIVSEINETIENSKIDLFEVVSELPEIGENNKVYLVPNNIEGNNSFTEYIYIEPNWEKIGEVQSTIEFDNYYTTGQTYSRDEISNLIKDFITSDKLNTNDVKLSENIDFNEENGKAFYSSGTSVQAILQNIHERIKQINSNIDSQISGITEIIPGTAVDVNANDSAVSPTISVKIYEPKEGEEENAIVISGDSLYVKSLENRLAELETLLAKVVTIDNIGDYAVTSIEYGDATNDISINKGEKGKYTLTLDSITNIAYNDATEISE